MKRYDNYKPSGIPWLGDVPSHWEVKHSNLVFRIHNGATPKTSESGYWGDEIVWITPKDLGDNSSKEISGSLKMITKEGYENCGVSLAPAQSIALSKRAPIGHLAITTIPSVVNQGCFLLEVLKQNNVNYLYYWLYANKVVLNSFGQGSTFMGLPREKFAMLKICIPPFGEQTAIADYLDDKLGDIDALIGKQQQLLDKLAEQRTAAITAAVCRGLNPDVPMKNSGIKWLGEVPEHWDMKKVKQVLKEHSGNGFPIDLQGDNGEVPFLKVSDLNKKGKILTDPVNSVSKEIIAKMKWNIVPKFSLVTAKIGEALKKNHRKIISQDSIIDNNCIAFECLNIDLNYHYYLSLIIDFDWFENGGTVPSLSVQKYRNQKICIPPQEEQTAIADYLDQETARIDRLCETVRQTISRLQEYRTALITQAVTGKIKVV